MSGLKSMEHGVLGEARAKAFLLERFWLLERSVDIQGADFLIQRRLTGSNFMDQSPPRLGVIQVKYVQDGDTYIKISKNYLCDKDGHPYNEFFVLVFTGRESNSRSFLLSPKDFLQISLEKSKSDKTFFQLKSSVLFGSGNHEIIDHTLALDRIDHALINSDFLKNRRFIGATNYVDISPDHIEHDLLLPLDNCYADIGKMFYEEKKKLQQIVFGVEDILSSMQSILRSTDVEDAYRIYEDELSPQVGSGYGIHISAKFFDDDDFLSAVKHHKNRLEAIRALGVEAGFFALLRKIENEIPSRIAAFTIVKNTWIRISVIYDDKTLSNARVTVEMVAGTDDSLKLISSKHGRHEIDFKPFQCFSWDVRNGSVAPPVTTEEIETQIREQFWRIRRPLQSEIEKWLIGEELAISW